MIAASSDTCLRLSPGQVADALPSRPKLTTGDGRWDRAVLQQYSYPPCLIGLAPVRDHIVVLDLSISPLLGEPLSHARKIGWRTNTCYSNFTPDSTSATRRSVGGRNVLLLHLTPDLVQEVEKAAYGDAVHVGRLPAQVAVGDGQMYRLAQLLLFEAKNQDAPGQTHVSNLLIKSLIVQILRLYSSSRSSPFSAYSASADPRIERALAFMRQNLADKITADQLATVSGASRSSFSRLFREGVGQSAHQYLIALRLEHALRLLEKTSLSIMEIAFDSGFGQPEHFTTVFRRRFGVSPRARRSAHCALKSLPPEF